MTSSDYLPPPDPSELRSQILASAPDPAQDLADFALIVREAQNAMITGTDTVIGPQLRVRLAGVGVTDHQLPVHTATQILDSVQSVVTAVGSAVRRLTNVKLPKDKVGKRLSTAAALTLNMSPAIAAGSIVFTLEGPPELKQEGELDVGAGDSLLDAAIAEMFRIISRAQDDQSVDIGQLTSEIQRHGVRVAASLHRLADQALDSDIEIDLGLRSPSGRRRNVTLGYRGAAALRDAVDRSKARAVTDTFIGTLRTVSDGLDSVKLELDDKTKRRMSVDRETGLALGPMLGERVRCEVETTVTWKMAQARETRSHHLLSAELVSNQGSAS